MDQIQSIIRTLKNSVFSWKASALTISLRVMGCWGLHSVEILRSPWDALYPMNRTRASWEGSWGPQRKSLSPWSLPTMKDTEKYPSAAHMKKKKKRLGEWLLVPATVHEEEYEKEVESLLSGLLWLFRLVAKADIWITVSILLSCTKPIPPHTHPKKLPEQIM